MGILKLIKNYRELGGKEFLRRWKEGTQSVSPLEQTKAQIVFTRITLLGMTLGFGVSIWQGKNLWWLALILGGAIGNTYISYLGLKQKIKLLEQFNQLNNQEEVNNV
jgi:hypothetical protein